MKRSKSHQIVLFALAFVAFAASAVAKVPNVINYQGRLTDTDGTPVADDTYFIKFKIYGSESGDDSLWYTPFQPVNVTDGLFNYKLGSAVPLPHDLFTADTTRYLGITVGGDPEIIPRSKITSTAYAYHALTADTASFIDLPLIMVGSDALYPLLHLYNFASPSSAVRGSNDQYFGVLGYHIAGVFGAQPGITEGYLAGDEYAVHGYNYSSDNYGYLGGTEYSVYGESPDGHAGQFEGDVHINGDLTMGSIGSGFDIVAYSSAHDSSRFFWDGLKGALRVGRSFGDEWDNANIGLYSLAVGRESKASGEASISLGADCQSIGDRAVALGNGSQAMTFASVAIGTASVASGGGSIALGDNVNASGLESIAIGRFLNAGPAPHSMIIGTGLGLNDRLTNDNEYSLMVGFKSTEPMLFVDENGVGIGTTETDAQLEVGEILRVRGDNYGTAIYPDSGAGVEITYRPYDNTGIIQVYNRDTSGADAWGDLYLGDGKVGIGEINPSQKLHVDGNICYTGTIGGCSDVRYKRDISTVTDALEKVSRIHGVTFKWRKDDYPEQNFSQQEQIGFVAQEIKDIVPQVIMQDDAGYYSVDYGRLTPLLVEAIKELKAENEELRRRITALESR